MRDGTPGIGIFAQAISCALAAIAYFTAVRFSLVSIAWALLFIMLVRFGMMAAITFRLLDISWAEASVLLIRRAAFSAVFGALTWCLDQLLLIFHFSAGLRLGILGAFCVALLGWAVWSAGNIVFGQHAIQFMLTYATHLPPAYVKRLRLQTRPVLHKISRALSLPFFLSPNPESLMLNFFCAPSSLRDLDLLYVSAISLCTKQCRPAKCAL